MKKTNIKASNSTMSNKLYKLSDFIPEFSKFRTNEDNFLFVSTRKGKKNILSQLMLFVLSVGHEMLLKMELILGN